MEKQKPSSAATASATYSSFTSSTLSQSRTSEEILGLIGRRQDDVHQSQQRNLEEEDLFRSCFDYVVKSLLGGDGGCSLQQEELKKIALTMVEQSKVLNTTGADKQTKRELFDALRQELEYIFLCRTPVVSKLVWDLILDNEGFTPVKEKEENEQRISYVFETTMRKRKRSSSCSFDSMLEEEQDFEDLKELLLMFSITTYFREFFGNEDQTVGTSIIAPPNLDDRWSRYKPILRRWRLGYEMREHKRNVKSSEGLYETSIWKPKPPGTFLWPNIVGGGHTICTSTVAAAGAGCSNSLSPDEHGVDPMMVQVQEDLNMMKHVHGPHGHHHHHGKGTINKSRKDFYGTTTTTPSNMFVLRLLPTSHQQQGRSDMGPNIQVAAGAAQSSSTQCIGSSSTSTGPSRLSLGQPTKDQDEKKNQDEAEIPVHYYFAPPPSQVWRHRHLHYTYVLQFGPAVRFLEGWSINNVQGEPSIHGFWMCPEGKIVHQADFNKKLVPYERMEKAWPSFRAYNNQLDLDPVIEKRKNLKFWRENEWNGHGKKGPMPQRRYLDFTLDVFDILGPVVDQKVKDNILHDEELGFSFLNLKAFHIDMNNDGYFATIHCGIRNDLQVLKEIRFYMDFDDPRQTLNPADIQHGDGVKRQKEVNIITYLPRPN